MFCTIPISVADTERSFSILKKTKHIQCSPMTQQRLSELGVIAIESKSAQQLNFDQLIK